MKFLLRIATVLFFGLSGNALAQQTSDIHQQTTPPSGARFEVVQSELAAKWTFRLDRFTGHVAQLVRTKDDDNTWEDMTIDGLPVLASQSHPRFLLFTSGVAAKFTFLIDTDTGKTWTLLKGHRTNFPGDPVGYDIDYWQPFAD